MSSKLSSDYIYGLSIVTRCKRKSIDNNRGGVISHCMTHIIYIQRGFFVFALKDTYTIVGIKVINLKAVRLITMSGRKMF